MPVGANKKRCQDDERPKQVVKVDLAVPVASERAALQSWVSAAQLFSTRVRTVVVQILDLSAENLHADDSKCVEYYLLEEKRKYDRSML